MSRPGIREWLAIGGVIAGGNLLRNDSGAKHCRKFEEELSEFFGVRRSLAVSSGTAGLVCALQACGIGPGDEVLVPAYTWMGTAGAVLLAGAVPVMVEVNETLTIDADDLRAKVTPRSRAVIPVHMINRPCNMDAVLEVARDHDLRVIEDACQAIGVKYRGQYCGTMGDIGVFSFNRYKNMTCGEGGAVLTNDAALMDRMVNAHDIGISYRGNRSKDQPIFIGNNYRISEIQGAMLRVQLSRLPRQLRQMRRRSQYLARTLRDQGYRLAPENDEHNSLLPVVRFDTEQEAEAFAKAAGARKLFDNSKHIYTEWSSILERRTAHPAYDPWSWANIAAGRELHDCPRTLDLLRRSCAVDLRLQLPQSVVSWILFR